ncbi:hypothetical protein [Sagittula salina]|uniref:Uncharacterized protein n=1 Tax=Sagittula salina TaxID=2820268 RepID=A0A940S510_9RHOB|nr:hypothetical protein [Sagittula salina]MBP0484669.1 hypothetical protein [Sagittula salina]
MLHQTPAITSGRETPPNPRNAGMIAAAIYEHAFLAAFTAASDILEIGPLPFGARMIEAELITGDLGAGVTATLVTLSGNEGEANNARVEALSIQSGIAAHNASIRLATANLLAVTPGKVHRGLGLKFSANIAAGGTKTVKLLLKYTF